MYSSVAVSQELQSGALVQAHPLSLPGYGSYLIALGQNVRHADIEALAAWMGIAC